jgi:tetratricopeptide (TPR) repeat protein
MEHSEGSPCAGKREWKATIYLEQKKFDLAVREAKSAWETCKKSHADAPVYNRDFYAYIRAMTGNSSQAEEVAKGLKRDIEPTDLLGMQRYWWALGAIELAKGDPASAVTCLEKSLEGASNRVTPSRVLLAKAQLELDGRGEAVGALERMLSSYDVPMLHDPISSVKAHYLLGLAYEKSGWKDKAIQQYQEFLEIWKDADPGMAEIGDAHLCLARLKGAAEK